MSDFQQALLEIVEHIQIGQDFSICHPEYFPIELQPDAIARFQQIPLDLQRKYLIGQIQNYIYDIYFTHSLMTIKEVAAESQQLSQLKNNIVNGVDVDFYQRLEQSNSSTGYLDHGWKIIAQIDSGELIVLKDELHLHIQPQQHLDRALTQINIGDIVSIYLPHNSIGQDTYIAIGNFGTPANSTQSNTEPDRSVQLYFNFTPDVAVAISQQLIGELNQLGVPFQFAIFHDPVLFYRYDSGTLWIFQSDYFQAQTLVAKIYQAYQSEFSPHVPLGTKQLALGLGLAEVPITAGTFGMQLCEMIAIGLFVAMDQGKTLATEKLNCINRELSAGGIDLFRPYLNPAALDRYSIYTI
jgi:HopA1 effector protein family